MSAKSVSTLKSHQDAPQEQIGDSTMAEAVQLVKALETPYLRDLAKLIDHEITSRKRLERNEAVFKIQKLAVELGVSVEELIGSAMPRKGNSGPKKTIIPAPAKYRNPANPALTWAGRGIAPKWVKDWEDANGSRDGLLIAKA